MTVTIDAMTMDDYDAAYALWQHTEGMAGGKSDSRESIAAYLKRNPGISSVAKDEGAVVGVILAGHDGRRGTLWRLAVDGACRRQGIGERLVERSIGRLRAEGIEKAYIFVFRENAGGLAFWKRLGWIEGEMAVSMWRNLIDVPPAGCS